MPEKSTSQKTGPRPPTPEFEALIRAARAVVRAHRLRDRGEADDGDVSDCIAELEDSIPRPRKRIAAKSYPNPTRSSPARTLASSGSDSE